VSVICRLNISETLCSPSFLVVICCLSYLLASYADRRRYWWRLSDSLSVCLCVCVTAHANTEKLLISFCADRQTDRQKHIHIIPTSRNIAVLCHANSLGVCMFFFLNSASVFAHRLIFVRMYVFSSCYTITWWIKMYIIISIRIVHEVHTKR